MRLAYIAAGAAGMYCGTCIHDNTLATELMRQGVDVALIPTYTPLRTDEADVSLERIFYGGINVFLQQKWSLFRHTPRLLDRPLDHPSLLKMLSRFSASTSAADLGELTVSVLKGEEGHQKKELARLAQWLRNEFKPDLIHLTNSMFVGMSRELKETVGVQVLCGLQGEDIFLEGLPEPYKAQAKNVLRKRAQDADAFIAPCQYYRDYMAAYMAVDAEKIHVVHLGLHLEGHGEKPRTESTPPRIGYLARICPEKGFHLLVEAFRILSDEWGAGELHLDVAGYLGGRDRSYFDEQVKRIEDWGLSDFFTYRGEVNRAEKIDFLNGLHLLSVPTVYAEPKGLFVLEALANGTPVVLPEHGSFPETIRATGGGILVEPDSPKALASGIDQLLRDDAQRLKLGQLGKKNVQQNYSDASTAAATLEVYRRFVEV
jgi:glycosyltransferase involved in cell wall biosynthesis